MKTSSGPPSNSAAEVNKTKLHSTTSRSPPWTFPGKQQDGWSQGSKRDRQTDIVMDEL